VIQTRIAATALVAALSVATAARAADLDDLALEDPSTAGAHCQKMAQGLYTIDRRSRLLLARKTNVDFLRPEHIELAFRNHQPRGIKLNFSDDSFLAKCGFRTGDIVTAMNGRSTAVADIEAGLRLLLELEGDVRKRDRAEFALLRHGERVCVVLVPAE
jgi:hypothetical protein